MVGWAFRNSYPSGRTFPHISHTTKRIASECAVMKEAALAAGAAAPPASPPTLAGIFKTEGNSTEGSTNLVSASVRT
jgi:hypothetical protein